MKLLNLYPGSITDFTNQFLNNEALYNQARAFWSSLESISGLLFLLAIALGVFFAVIYYVPWNNMPGRHYRPSHWIGFLIATFLFALGLTIGFEYWHSKPRLDGALALEIKIALVNALYATAVYFVISLVWCNWKLLPTNAYKWFKI